MSEACKFGKKIVVNSLNLEHTSLTSMDPKKEELAKGVELEEAKPSSRMENSPLSSSESLNICIRHCLTEDAAVGELLISSGK